MEVIQGKYTEAIIFTTENSKTSLDQYARAQLQMICNNECSKDSKIRIMPDVHPGKVGTIGLTMTVGDRVMPELIGIDIGCGVTVAKINKGRREWQKLDSCIRENIPSGFSVRSKSHAKADQFDFEKLLCADHINVEKAKRSLGTLGGGNHFIEIDTDEDGGLYAVIHTGSRHLGKEVTEYYLQVGQKALKEAGVDIPYEMTYLEGALKDAYLRDMEVVQEYAALNREIILSEIIKGMKWKAEDLFSSMHNYIASDKQTLSWAKTPVLRKGAISARKGEKVIIPINMRDGVILGTGLGNVDWNCSAPHGSGRIIRRDSVKNEHSVSEFKASMKGIYSSSISAATLDEAPFAYRPIDEIRQVIGPTVEINKVLKPVYNFKAG